jgi:tetratricopeptide (TPR) repeat protein
MGILDLVRPGWKHSNKAVRLAAVHKLSHTRSELLSRIAKSDSDPDVRMAAVEKLDSGVYLGSVAEYGRDPDVCMAAVDKLTDQATLGSVARSARTLHARWAAVDKLTDQNALTYVARFDTSNDVRVAASERLAELRAEQLERHQALRNGLDIAGASEEVSDSFVALLLSAELAEELGERLERESKQALAQLRKTLPKDVPEDVQLATLALALENANDRASAVACAIRGLRQNPTLRAARQFLKIADDEEQDSLRSTLTGDYLVERSARFSDNLEELKDVFYRVDVPGKQQRRGSAADSLLDMLNDEGRLERLERKCRIKTALVRHMSVQCTTCHRVFSVLGFNGEFSEGTLGVLAGFYLRLTTVSHCPVCEEDMAWFRVPQTSDLCQRRW